MFDLFAGFSPSDPRHAPTRPTRHGRSEAEVKGLKVDYKGSY